MLRFRYKYNSSIGVGIGIGIEIFSVMMARRCYQAFMSQGNKIVGNTSTTKRIRGYGTASVPFWFELNKTANTEYTYPTVREVQRANKFFELCKVKFEWSSDDYDTIPSEVAKLKAQTIRNPNANKIYGGRTGIPFEMINPLPEVVFLGRSNAGKSTLLNALVTELRRDTLVEAAKSSKKAGFTRTLNCFNIGNKFRVVDTPGYGFRSSSRQGHTAVEYLRRRPQLLRCYLLVSGPHGVTTLDEQLIDLLVSLGRPFDVVFTKMDKLTPPGMDKLDKLLQGGLPTTPRLIFTNALSTPGQKRRYGVDILRACVLETCLPSRLQKSSKTK